jgi:hypothetical protein
MTETLALLQRAEEDLVRTAEISSSTCSELAKVSPGAVDLVRNALALSVCPGGAKKGNASQHVAKPAYVRDKDQRIAAIRLMLVKLKLHTDGPVWSSEVLRRAVDGALAVSGGELGDLFQAIFDVFADYPVDLTEARANFIKDLVVECFTRRRSAYDSSDWESFCKGFNETASSSQLYLALLAVPPDCLPGRLAAAITSGLAHTPYRDEAVALNEAASP